MKYYNIEPVADAEMAEYARVDFTRKPRKIIHMHVYVFNYPESDLIQSYPVFLVTNQLKESIEAKNLSGAEFLPCVVEKADQYDDFSPGIPPPLLWCFEPCGKIGDDLIFLSETKFTASERFMDVLKHFSSVGCIIEPSLVLP